MTLIEVVLSAAILGILAVAVATALFYPSYLVVNSSLEQSAIHAGTAEIERHLYSHLNPATSGVFRTAGWAINDADIVTTITPTTNNINGDPYTYLVVASTITYRDGKTVELITYRSLAVINSSR